MPRKHWRTINFFIFCCLICIRQTISGNFVVLEGCNSNNYLPNNNGASNTVRAGAGTVASLGRKYYKNFESHQKSQRPTSDLNSHSCCEPNMYLSSDKWHKNIHFLWKNSSRIGYDRSNIWDYFRLHAKFLDVWCQLATSTFLQTGRDEKLSQEHNHIFHLSIFSGYNSFRCRDDIDILHRNRQYLLLCDTLVVSDNVILCLPVRDSSFLFLGGLRFRVENQPNIDRCQPAGVLNNPQHVEGPHISRGFSTGRQFSRYVSGACQRAPGLRWDLGIGRWVSEKRWKLKLGLAVQD